MKVSLATFLFFFPTLVLLSGCQPGAQQTNFASAARPAAVGDEPVPKYITIESSYTAKKTYNQSFPEITFTSPAGEYVLDQEKSGQTNLYYRSPAVFQVNFNSGHEVKGETTMGYLVVSRKDAIKRSLKPADVIFHLDHTESTLAFSKGLTANNGYRTASNNSAAALMAESIYNVERSANNKQSLKGISFQPEYHLHIGTGGTNKIRNGNRFAHSPAY